MKIFEEIIGKLILGALAVIGAAVVGLVTYFLIRTIVKKVSEFITKSNIGRLIKTALRESNEKKAKELLGGAIKGVVAKKKPNVVSIELFNEEDEEKVRLNLETSMGVSDDITEGMTVFC